MTTPRVIALCPSLEVARGVCGVCGTRRGRRLGFGGIHETLAGHAGALPAVSAEDGLVPTGGRRVAGRADGLVCAAGSGRRLWVCRRGTERQDDRPVNGAAR